MSRLSRRLARKHRAASNDPPAQVDGAAKVRTAIQQLRSTARGDAATTAICDEVQRLIDSGWIERRGPFEPRRWPLHEAWGGKEPPERP
jgi:hypothetical protein